MDIKTAQQQFLDYLRYEKRFSPHTITAYSADLDQFITYCIKSYEILALQEINSQVVRSWIVSLMENEIIARSVNRKITSLKTFYKFLLREELVSENPMLKIQAPKTGKRLPVFVEKEKMMHLLDNVGFGSDFEGIRNRLVIEMFYGTGMRLSELLNLKIADIDLYNSQLKVLGKRNKERVIPFNHELGRQIRDYLKFIENFENKEGFFFTTEKGVKLYEKLVYGIVKAYLSQVTTAGKKSPHVLRHTFATHMLNNGADLNAIKEILGHANLAATQVYTHNTVEKLKSIHKQAHPKA
jgi:integrase/recombinase XerC